MSNDFSKIKIFTGRSTHLTSPKSRELDGDETLVKRYMDHIKFM